LDQKVGLSSADTLREQIERDQRSSGQSRRCAFGTQRRRNADRIRVPGPNIDSIIGRENRPSLSDAGAVMSARLATMGKMGRV
jgi:hypothetical protein